jgi:hypothetical protein
MLVLLLLFLNILPDGSLVIPHGTDAIASGPNMQAGHPFLVQQLTMDSDSTFAFHEKIFPGTINERR